MSYYHSGHVCARYNQSASFQRYTKYLITDADNTQGVMLLKTEAQTDGSGYYRAVCSDGTPISNLDDWLSSHTIVKYNTADALVPSEPQYPTTTAYTARAVKIGVGSRIYKGNGDDYPKSYLVECNIPIFDVTDGDYSKVNRYITDGDDSGADNYEDLHPITLESKVWFDGNFPNLNIQTNVVSGDFDKQMHLKISRAYYNEPNPEFETIYENDYNLGEMQYLTFGQYGNVNSIKDYVIEIWRSDIPTSAIAFVYWTATCKWYMSTDTGELSNIETWDSLNGLHTISYEQGVPDDTDYPKENSDWNDPQTHNTISGANTLTKTYQINDTKLRALGNFLWSSTFKDNVLSLTNYPLENVVSLKAMPLTLTGTNQNIMIGNVNSNIEGTVINNADTIETTVGEVEIRKQFNNFMDYSAVQLVIYLPFIGFKQLDNVAVMGRKIRIKYYFDTILGNCLASIEVKDNNGNYLLYDCYQANCGVDIAITSTNRASIENGYIKSAINTVADLTQLNPLGAVSEVFNASTQDFHSQSNGVGNPSVMSALDMKCYVIMKKPQPYDPQTDVNGSKLGYGHFVGYPCHLYKKLKDLKITTTNPNNVKGCYFQVKNFIASEIPNATYEEKQKLKELLETGVILYDR